MAGPVFSNNATSLLAASITSTATQLTIASADAARFPAPGANEWFPVTVVDAGGNMEIMRCTARTGNVLTVVRGEEQTSAKPFAVNSRVDLRPTAGALLAKLNALDFNGQSVLDRLLTVDGPGSDLDADTLDGNHAAAFAKLVGAIFDTGISINGAAGTNRTIAFSSAGKTRWMLGVDTVAEAGGNTGSRLFVTLHDDAGAYLRTVLIGDRVNGMAPQGQWDFAHNVSVGTLQSKTGSIGVNTPGNGRVELAAGSSSNPGYVAFLSADGTRRGFIGWQYGTNNLAVMSENGWNYNFSQVPLFAGVRAPARGEDVNFRDLTATRGDASGTIYFGNTGLRYLHYDGSNGYHMPGAELWVNGQKVRTWGNTWVPDVLTYRGVGSYIYAALGNWYGEQNFGQGATIGGDQLRMPAHPLSYVTANAGGINVGFGTWRCMGNAIVAGTGGQKACYPTLWVRIA